MKPHVVGINHISQSFSFSILVSVYDSDFLSQILRGEKYFIVKQVYRFLACSTELQSNNFICMLGFNGVR